MTENVMHWVIPILTLIIAVILQKLVASKLGGNWKFIVPVIYLIVMIGFYFTHLSSLSSTIILIVLGEFFIVSQGYKSDRSHDETA
ncbi:hypothetical protein K2V61_10500 [Staphylococcus simulans]|uniref:hypothetical protein n=1 Tax=Staphylococcus simulans TaxID=1286 RepID=UPI001E627280|nr:hypothetical protein [Staphylococcus simulans]MCD8915975.1 hypothetical protein [Staphylococcus simulans]